MLIMGNQTIKLTIDEEEVEVEKGRTILEAAQSAGVRIPTLCYDRRLAPFGACRLCVVQEKGKSELLPACFTPAKNGMEIITNSQKIFESRRLQIHLILLNHPMICPRCEKEGDCDLQALVYEYGVKETIYPWEPIIFSRDDHSPLLQRDLNKCILCGRCVRICDEVQGIGELSFTQRGIKTAIDTDFHRPIHCEFCGQCLDTCPVGAITSDCFDYTTKAWELDETTTPCPYCGCGCLLTIGFKGGEIKRVFAAPEKGPNDGNLCVKGRFGWDFVDHMERIEGPLMKVNGTLKEVSWEEAFGFAAHKLEEIKGQYGSEGIGGIVSSRLTNEEYYLFKRLFRTALGSNQIDHDRGRTYRGLTEGLAKTLGLAASTNSIQEIRKSDCLLVVGVDPAQTHPIIKNEINLAIRRNRAQLIVLGNYDIGLTRSTKISPLSPPAIVLLEKPGMEISLLNMMIGTILREGLEDKAFIEEKTEGIEELREKQVEIKVEVERAARSFALAKRAMILIGLGPWSQLDSKGIAIASSNLALITGHVGKESCGIMILLEKCNSQGAIDMGIFPEGEEDRGKHLLQKAEEGKLKALYLVGEPPLITPKALENLQLLIVQDLFMTDIAKMAHLVLPACSFVEKGGTFTNLERRVQRLHPLRPPRDQSKSDFDIFLQILRLLETHVAGETPESIFKDICLNIPHYQWVQDGSQWPNGSHYLYSDGFPIGKAKLIPVETEIFPSNPEGYPFQLIQRPSLFVSGLLSSKSNALKKVSEKPYLEMNPEDAKLLKIEDGDLIQVLAAGGRSLKTIVKYSPRLASGVTTLPYPCPLLDEGGVVPVRVERSIGGRES